MTRIVVLGDLNLDVRAELPQDLPWGGEARTAVQVVPGGSAGNFARAARREGAEVLFVGCVGQDAAGDLLLQSLRAQGIKAHVRRVANPTGTIVSLWKGRERTLLCSRGANDGLDASWIEESFFREANHLHLSGYAFLSSSQQGAARRAIAMAHSRELTISVDPPPGNLIRRFGVAAFLREIETVDWVFPNLDEGEALSGTAGPESIVERLAARFAAGALTLGKDGSLAWSQEERAQATVEPLDLVDTTGAGDAFAAGFVVAFLAGAALPEANRRGSEAAARHLGG